jgi:hypothetical protein
VPQPPPRTTSSAAASRTGASWLMRIPAGRDENGTDIFRPYSRPNLFRWVLIRPYLSPDI